MRSRRGSLVMVGLVTMCALQVHHPRRAAAQAPSLPPDHAGADQHLQSGYALLARGQDVAALDEFERAYELAPTPTALVLIATAEQALGRWEDADRHLSKALRATNDPYIEAQRTLLQQMQANGQRHLQRAVATRTFGPAEAPVQDVQRAAPTGRSEAEDASPGRTVGNLAIGAGALGLTLGGMALVVRHTAQAKFDSVKCSNDPGVPDFGGGRCGMLHDTSSTAGTWAKIGLGAGGALLVTGLLIRAISLDPPPANRTALSCGIAGARTVACTGRF